MRSPVSETLFAQERDETARHRPPLDGAFAGFEHEHEVLPPARALRQDEPPSLRQLAVEVFRNRRRRSRNRDAVERRLLGYAERAVAEAHVDVVVAGLGERVLRLLDELGHALVGDPATPELALDPPAARSERLRGHGGRARRTTSLRERPKPGKTSGLAPAHAGGEDRQRDRREVADERNEAEERNERPRQP